MTISERIFARLKELSITQKELSDMTGIMPNTICMWKKKKTNPTSDKIMKICEVLKVSPEWLLAGMDIDGEEEESVDYYVVWKNSEYGTLLEKYKKLNNNKRERLMGFLEALLQKTCS